MKIQIKGKSKINNPTDFVSTDDPAYVYSYQGAFNKKFFNDPFFFQYQPYLKHQENNLNKLVDYMTSIGLQFEYMWLILFRNELGNISTSFVIKTNTNNEGLTIFWRKYLSRSAGSGQNDVYLVRDDEYISQGYFSNIRVQLKSFLNNPESWLQPC